MVSEEVKKAILERERRTGEIYRCLDEATERVTPDKIHNDQRVAYRNIGPEYVDANDKLKHDVRINEYRYDGDEDGNVSFHSHILIQPITMGRHLISRHPNYSNGAYERIKPEFKPHSLVELLERYDVYRVPIATDSQFRLQGFDLMFDVFLDGKKLSQRHYTTRTEPEIQHIYLFIEKNKISETEYKSRLENEDGTVKTVCVKTIPCSPFPYTWCRGFSYLISQNNQLERDPYSFVFNAVQVGSFQSEDDLLLYITSIGYIPYISLYTAEINPKSAAPDTDWDQRTKAVRNFTIKSIPRDGLPDDYLSMVDNSGYEENLGTYESSNHSDVMYMIELADHIKKLVKRRTPEYVHPNDQSLMDNTTYKTVYVINRRQAFGYNIFEKGFTVLQDSAFAGTYPNGEKKYYQEYKLNTTLTSNQDLLPMYMSEVEMYNKDGIECYPNIDFFYSLHDIAIYDNYGEERINIRSNACLIFPPDGPLDGFSTTNVADDVLQSRIAPASPFDKLIVVEKGDFDSIDAMVDEMTRLMNDDKNRWLFMLCSDYGSSPDAQRWDLKRLTANMYTMISLSVDGKRLCPITDYEIDIEEKTDPVDIGEFASGVTYGKLLYTVSLKFVKPVTINNTFAMRITPPFSSLFINAASAMDRGKDFSKTPEGLTYVDYNGAGYDIKLNANGNISGSQDFLNPDNKFNKFLDCPEAKERILYEVITGRAATYKTTPLSCLSNNYLSYMDYDMGSDINGTVFRKLDSNPSKAHTLASTDLFPDEPMVNIEHYTVYPNAAKGKDSEELVSTDLNFNVEYAGEDGNLVTEAIKTRGLTWSADDKVTGMENILPYMQQDAKLNLNVPSKILNSARKETVMFDNPKLDSIMMRRRNKAMTFHSNNRGIVLEKAKHTSELKPKTFNSQIQVYLDSEKKHAYTHVSGTCYLGLKNVVAQYLVKICSASEYCYNTIKLVNDYADGKTLAENVAYVDVLYLISDGQEYIDDNESSKRQEKLLKSLIDIDRAELLHNRGSAPVTHQLMRNTNDILYAVFRREAVDVKYLKDSDYTIVVKNPFCSMKTFNPALPEFEEESAVDGMPVIKDGHPIPRYYNDMSKADVHDKVFKPLDYKVYVAVIYHETYDGFVTGRSDDDTKF